MRECGSIVLVLLKQSDELLVLPVDIGDLGSHWASRMYRLYRRRGWDGENYVAHARGGVLTCSECEDETTKGFVSSVGMDDGGIDIELNACRLGGLVGWIDLAVM